MKNERSPGQYRRFWVGLRGLCYRGLPGPPGSDGHRYRCQRGEGGSHQRWPIAIVEPGLSQLIACQVPSGRLRATTSVAEAVDESELAFIAVGTPSSQDGGVDGQAIERVIGQIAAQLPAERPYVVVVRSTLLPGSLEERLVPLLADRPQAVLCNHPEFLRETTAINDFLHPPLIVVGAKIAPLVEWVMRLYDPLIVLVCHRYPNGRHGQIHQQRVPCPENWFCQRDWCLSRFGESTVVT